MLSTTSALYLFFSDIERFHTARNITNQKSKTANIIEIKVQNLVLCSSTKGNYVAKPTKLLNSAKVISSEK